MSRVFRLGYVDIFDAPFIYPCILHTYRGRWCSKPGISGDIWIEVARSMNYTLQFIQADAYGGYEPEANGKYAGILGQIEDGKIDATLTFQSIRPSRFAHFNYSQLAQSYESGLVIGEIIETKKEIQVQVFNWLVVALLVGFLGVVALLNTLVLSRRSLSQFHLNWININPTLLRFTRLQCSLPNSVLALAFTIVNLTYFAGFRSQVMTASQHSTNRLIDQFFADPRSKVVTRTDAMLTREHRLALFGTPNARDRVLVQPDIDVIARTLCADPHVAYYTDRVDIFLNSRSELNCNFKTLSGNASVLSFKGTRGYIVSKKVPTKELERINEIILKMFNIDRNEEYLYPKYGIFPRNIKYDGHIFLQNMSISLNQLTEGCVFVFASFLTAALLLLLEIYYNRKQTLKRVISISAPEDSRWIMRPMVIPVISNNKWTTVKIDVTRRYSTA